MNRPPHRGFRRGLVLAFDVGTTYSGISYAVLDPGEVPQVKSVTRFSGQEHQGASKIPSIIWYDRANTVRAIGPAAILPETLEKAEGENWFKAEWWKLNLAPDSLHQNPDEVHFSPSPLPHGKSICDVFADFLRYLHQCAQEYIEESHAGGRSLWESVKTNLTIIFSHPNGWEGRQQALLRKAAVQGGLIQDTSEDHKRIDFVTEGEASLNFCLGNGLSTDAIKIGQNILVIDAGGGTIDMSGYIVKSMSPILVEEIFVPECIMQGSAFVTRRAKQHFETKLALSVYGNERDINHITDCFDQTTKRLFKNSAEPVFVKFGTFRDTDPTREILNGRLKLSGAKVAEFIEPCVKSILTVVAKHDGEMDVENLSVLLVGGFAGSPWLFHQLQLRLGKLGISLSRHDGQTNKAVADGAVAYYLDRTVSSRVSRFTYGSDGMILYDAADAEHRFRQAQLVIQPSGTQYIPRVFFVILEKGTQVAEAKEFKKTFRLESFQYTPLDKIEANVLCYEGDGITGDYGWLDNGPDLFPSLCHIEGDISHVPKTMVKGPRGFYHYQDFDIVLLFGLTEFQAQLSWLENGVEKRSPAKILYT